MIFQSSKLLLLYDFNRFIPTLCWQHFLSWLKTQCIPLMEGAYFSWWLCTRFNTFLFFRVTCSENVVYNPLVDVMLQTFPNSYAKTQKFFSLILSCATGCLEPQQQKYHSEPGKLFFDFKTIQDLELNDCSKIRFWTHLLIHKSRLDSLKSVGMSNFIYLWFFEKTESCHRNFSEKPSMLGRLCVRNSTLFSYQWSQSSSQTFSRRLRE